MATTFGKQLKLYRLQTTDPNPGLTKNVSHLSQERFAELLSDYLSNRRQEPVFFSGAAAISSWETDNSLPRGLKRGESNRRVLTAIIHVLVQCKGIRSVDAANELLKSGGFASLSLEEQQDIFAVAEEERDLQDEVPSPTSQREVYADRFAGMETYFTNREELWQEFVGMVNAPQLPKKLLLLHGIGGVGKSSLLVMLYRHCVDSKIPVGLIAGDAVRSIPELLIGWNSGLSVAGIYLPTFTQASSIYQRMQSVAADRLRSAPKSEEDADSANEAFSHIRDAQLILDPAAGLTTAFLTDLSTVADQHRLVLMIDTYERLQSMDDWLCNFVRRLNRNVLVVVAGREVIKWRDRWEGWLAQVQLRAIEPMSPAHTQQLIERYYSASQLGSDMPVVLSDQILHFSHGLPLAVTTAVQLWVRHKVSSFAVVEADALRELVAQLRQGISPELIPVLEAAAVLRYFNRSLLHATMAQDEIAKAFDELCGFPFVRSDIIGRHRVYRIHDRVQEFLNKALLVDDPRRFREYHQRVSEYFIEEIARADSEDALIFELEQLYHIMAVDERIGVAQYRTKMEQLGRYRYIGRMQVVQNDIETYPLTTKAALLWRDYYRARVAYLQTQTLTALDLLEKIAENPDADALLVGYALCNLGEHNVRVENISQPGGFDRATALLERSRQHLPQDEPKLNSVFRALSMVYRHRNDWRMAAELLEQRADELERNGNMLGVAEIMISLKDVYATKGNWLSALRATNRGLQALSNTISDAYLRLNLPGSAPWALIWSGNYHAAERSLQELLRLERKYGEVWEIPGRLRDLGLIFAHQLRFEEAEELYRESDQLYSLRPVQAQTGGITPGYQGYTAFRQGELEIAARELGRSLSLKHKVGDVVGIPEVLVWLGQLAEISNDYLEAKNQYVECLTNYPNWRLHYTACAWVGLVRVHDAEGDHFSIIEAARQAEQLAQQYEYNDLLAALRLIQGHAAWDGAVSEWGQGFDAAFQYYCQSLIYALRYNRFLLDEVLSARNVYTPFRTIIAECLTRGEAGQNMLVALREWWQIRVNDVGTPRPETISQLPEGIPLLEAERLARSREPGDGRVQQTVRMQLEAAIERMTNPPRESTGRDSTELPTLS